MEQLKDLHIAISAITGTPRIVKFRKKSSEGAMFTYTDKYIDIPQEEWDTALIHYFDSFKPNTRQFAVLDNDWSFFLGGHFDTAESLIQCLKECIAEVERLKNEN